MALVLVMQRDNEATSNVPGEAKDSPPAPERIELSRSPAVGPTDVLCGRGRTSYNHGKNETTSSRDVG